MSKNTGVILILQQIQSLLLKRFRIFFRRYILATIILLLPFLLEAVLSGIIPSSTNLVNTLTGKVQSLGQYQLGVSDYATPQILPYYLNDSGLNTAVYVQSLMNMLYPSSSQVALDMQFSDSVNDYVLGLRKASLDNLIYHYYTGMRMRFRNCNI